MLTRCWRLPKDNNFYLAKLNDFRQVGPGKRRVIQICWLLKSLF